ncbi:GATA transcription factor 21 [Euphorbia peplus]|nr:GATA transcription factor 21 [Euphorbia peplus]
MDSSFGPFPIDLNEDHDQQHHHFHNLFSSSSKTTHHEDHNYASSSSSISYPFFISPSSNDSLYFQPLQHQDHEVENFYASNGGSLANPSVENEISGNKFSICKKEDRENGSVKWMSSKMRLMRKMMKSADQTVGNTSSENSNSVHKFEDHKGGSSSLELEVDDKHFLNNNNSTIRVCADCNTTKTPLWRSGPRGPKSLCNACGIRQRKARRALAAAQESANGAIFDTKSAGVKSTKLKNKDQKATNNSHLPFKKRCKFPAQGRGKKNKLCFEDLSSILLSKNSSFHQQVFPQDEKEAAVLLMALSYGLVRG